MEFNLDDEYYQKYQKYKQKYIMLKQLKNNNYYIGKGGELSWWKKLLGYSDPDKEISETFLVFHIPPDFLTDIIKLKEFESMVKIEAEKINEMNESSDVFMKSKDFFEKYTKGYIVTNVNGSWNARMINKESSEITFHADVVAEYVKSLEEEKKNLQEQINEPHDSAPDFSHKEGDQKTKINREIVDTIVKVKTDYSKNVTSTMISGLQDMITKIKDNVNVNMIKKYDDQILLNIAGDITPKTVNDDSFLTLLNGSLKIGPESPLNFILQIQNYNDSDENIVLFQELNAVTTSNKTWKDIKSIITADIKVQSEATKAKEEELRQQIEDKERAEMADKTQITT
jgi:hypothetical protein